MGYVATYRDSVVIPDKYNTGCKGTLKSMSEFFGSYYTEGEGLYITSALQNELGTVYENIDIDQVITLNKPGLSSMVFRNCRFSKNSSYAINTGSNFDSENVEVLFENCEFLNQTSACVQPTKNFKMKNCKIHDMGSDGGKVLDNGCYENCYIYNIGIAEDAHADGIQVTSENSNFSIINCRFDVPSYTGYTSNAAIFFILEGSSYNSTIKDCVMNGGNYTFYYGFKDTETGLVIENGIVDNITIGCGYRYGILNDNSNCLNRDVIKAADKLFVSSVYKENDKIKLLVTNYTNEEKMLVVVTDKGQTEVTIPKCPLIDESATYTSFGDFPFDIEVEVEGNYVVCYDNSISDENQIRYVEFAESEITIKELFTQTCNSIRAKDGTTGPIKHIDIPKRILALDAGGITPVGEVTITENGSFDVSTFLTAIVNVQDTGEGGMPSNIKTGIFTVDNDDMAEVIVPHNLGCCPGIVFIFPDNYNEIIGSTAYTFMGGTNAISYTLFTNNTKTLTFKINIMTISVDETNIIISGSNTTYKIRSGVNYRWLAWI